MVVVLVVGATVFRVVLLGAVEDIEFAGAVVTACSIRFHSAGDCKDTLAYIHRQKL